MIENFVVAQFSPLQWLFSFYFTLQANNLIASMRQSDLDKRLVETTKRWVETLPSNIQFDPSCIFRTTGSKGEPIAGTKAAREIRAKLAENKLPPSALLKRGLMSSWKKHRIDSGIENLVDGFFTLSEDEAARHLETLAQHLHDAYIQDEEIFRAFMARSVDSLSSQNTELIAIVKQTSAEVEIDRSSHLMESQEYVAARAILERLDRERRNQLSRENNVRVLKMLGRAYFCTGDTRKSAEAFLKLSTIEEIPEQRTAAKCKGLSLLGRHSDALEFAEAGLKETPGSDELIKVWISSLLNVDALQIKSRIDQIPVHLLLDNEIRDAILYSVVFARDFPFASKLLADWPNTETMISHYVRCRIMSAKVHPSQVAIAVRDYTEEERSTLDLALREINSAIELARQEKCSPRRESLVEFLLTKADLLLMLDMRKESSKTIDLVMREFPGRLDVIRAHANDLCQHGDFNKAIGVLEELYKGSQNPIVAIDLARAIRRSGGDKGKVLQFALEGIRDIDELSEIARMDTVQMIVHTAIELREFHVALSAIEKHGSVFGDVYRLALLGTVHAAEGNQQQTNEIANQALSCVNDQTPVYGVRTLARLLYNLGRHRDSLAVRNRVGLSVLDREELTCFAYSAATEEERGLVLEIAQHFRCRFGIEKPMISYEIDSMFVVDPLGVEELLRACIEEHPNDLDFNLSLSLFGLNCDRLDLVCTDPGKFTPPSLAEPQEGERIVWVLLRSGNTRGALEYAYEFVRSRPTTLESRKAYVSVFTSDIALSEDVIPDVSCVGADSAIQYSVDGRNPCWIYIEANEPKKTLSERAPTDSLVRLMMGLKAGDEFFIEKFGQQIRVRIISILHKFVRKWHECMERHFSEFPDDSTFGVLSVPKDTSQILENVKTQARARYRGRQEVLALYRNCKIPLHFASTQLGESYMETLADAVVDPTMVIMSRSPRKDDVDREVEWFVDSEELIVDVSALGTLLIHEGLLDLLVGDKKLLITPAVHRMIGELIRRQAASRRSLTVRHDRSGVVLGKDDGRPREEMAELLRNISSRLQVVDSRTLYEHPAKTRKEMSVAFGDAGAESILLAAKSARVLWTDDYIHSTMAVQGFALRSVSSLSALDAVRQLDEHRALAEIVKLAGAGYVGFRLSTNDVISVGRMDNWSFDGLLGILMRVLENRGMPASVRIRLSTDVFRALISEGVSPITSNAILSRVLTSASVLGIGDNTLQKLLPTIKETLAGHSDWMSEFERVLGAWRRARRAQ